MTLKKLGAAAVILNAAGAVAGAAQPLPAIITPRQWIE
jgi:hypothetical protein